MDSAPMVSIPGVRNKKIQQRNSVVGPRQIGEASLVIWFPSVSRFYDVNTSDEVVYHHTHNGEEYPFSLSDVYHKFKRGAENFLRRHQQPVGSRKAHVYHNAEAAGITCLGNETKKTLK